LPVNAGMFIAVVPYETAFFSTQWLLCLPVPVTDKKLEINYIGLVFALMS
jgi:hypothetical protein